MNYLRTSKEGSLLLVYLQPGASRDEIVGLFQERLKIKVKARPIEGEANKALINFISDFLKIPKSGIEILRGHQSRNKDLLIDTSVDKVLEKLTFKTT